MNFAAFCCALRSCTLCESSLPHAPNPVFQAHPEAKILIAGQAPGIRAHETSTPFNDPSGVRLRAWLGVDRETFYNPEKLAIIPMGFCYPGTSGRGDLPPRRACAHRWHRPLFALLPQVKLILPIGIYAQRFHLGTKMKRNLTETVHSWQDYAPRFIPLPHPSPRNHRWLKRNPWFESTVIPQLQNHIMGVLNCPVCGG